MELKSGIEEHVDEAWQAAWEAANDGEEADFSNAIFRAIGCHEALTLYFSPTAQLIAETFGAKPCDKPAATGMSMVAGDERAWEIHFRGTRGGPAKTPLAVLTAEPFEPTQPS